MPANVAIIVPAAPGDIAWRVLLAQLQGANAKEICLVLAEGDETPVDMHASAFKVLHAPVGRPRQLNAGVAASTADWLWFLHADSVLTPATLAAMHEFVGWDEDAIGYFQLRFLDDGPRWMFLNAWGAALRSRLLGLPFGDQGLLMPRRVLHALGGFDEGIDRGEDHALVWTAHARRIPVRALGASLRTSARRYAEQGWWRTTWQHLCLTRTQAAEFSRQARACAAIERA